MTNISGEELYRDSVRTKDEDFKEFSMTVKKDGREVETTFFHRKIIGRQRPDDPPELWSESIIRLPHPPGKIFEIPIDLEIVAN